MGTGPLLVTIALDGEPCGRTRGANPVGFGMLTFFTFWPSIALMVAGLGVGVADEGAGIWRGRAG